MTFWSVLNNYPDKKTPRCFPTGGVCKLLKSEKSNMLFSQHILSFVH
jgi:hypothetical protein